MVTIMEMTTGKWEVDDAAVDAHPGMAGCALDMLATGSLPSRRLALRESVSMRPRPAGMPQDVALREVDEFLAAMADPAR